MNMSDTSVPLSDVGCDRDAPNVNVDVVGEILRHP